MFKQLVMTFVLILSALSLSAQTKVTGQVTDESKNPLPGASIVVKGTSKGVVSDLDGNYEIQVEEGDVLEFSYIGFQPQTRTISKIRATQGGGKPLIINILLKEETNTLSEVVVTGYGGTREKVKLTNSIATVKKDILEKGSFSNPAQALSGAVSGVRVTQSSGKPGATPSIVLRGGTNLDGSGSPLIVIDGQVRGGLNDINPNDIESMEMLKDAGATAIYGARANNGVILVTTKRGKAGVSSLNINAKTGYGFQNFLYDYLDAREYLYWQRSSVNNAAHIYQDSNGAWKGYTNTKSLSTPGGYGTGNKHFDANGNVINPNMGRDAANASFSPMFSETLTPAQKQQLLAEGWETMTDPVTGKEIIFSNYDTKKTSFRPFSLTQDYSLSMSGGNEKGKYYAGLGYYFQEGFPIGNEYKRLNFVFNGEYKLKPWLLSSSNFSIARATWQDNINQTDDLHYYGRALTTPPTQKQYVNGEVVLGRGGNDGNPLVNAGKFFRDNVTNKFNFGQTFKVDLYKDLSLTLNGHIMFDEGIYESFNKDHLASPNVINKNRSTSASFNRTLRQTYNGILNYKTTLGKHTFDAMALYEFYDNYNRGFSASGREAPTDDFRDLGLTSTAEGKREIDSHHSRIRIKSYAGRLNYDYDAKYLASFTVRKDGYSSLLGDNRWGVFPGVSAGWVFTKENFLQNITDILSFGKLRGSFGLNGNASGIGAYTLQGSYSTTKYKTEVGYLIGNLPNPGLQWEKSRTFEGGLDLGLNNRYTLNTTYYNRLTLDKYATLPLPISSGISGINSNTGKFRNTGVEIEGTFNFVKNDNWNWTVTANATYNVNTVVKLMDNGLERNRQNAFQVYDGTTGNKIWVGGYQEGQTPGDIYVFIAEGIFKDEAHVREIANNRIDETTSRRLYGPEEWAKLSDAEKEKGLPIQPGDVIWKDINGDGKIDQFDKEKVGNSTPKWTGGLTSTLKYKGVSLYVRMDYALGHKQYLAAGGGSLPWLLGNMQGTFNTTTDVRDTWTPENPDAKYPRYLWADQNGKSNYNRVSSMFTYNASYLAFREISLSYRFDKEMAQKLYLSDLDISLTGQNLGYWTNAKTYTPEVGGFTYGLGYSLPKTIILGINLTF
ncbi:MAG: TonB-dependent receptor [Capnocytophaga felis]|nr:TonB-dependent receptor [Capnocytophaga felis]